MDPAASAPPVRFFGNRAHHDPRRAAQALDAAGWDPRPDAIRARNGHRLSLVRVIAGPGDTDPHDGKAAAELIQDQLKRVGIEAKIVVPEAAAGMA